MRMVAGLETPDSGEVWLDDREITRLEPRDRHIGMMFQGYALYPQMSVRDNIAYPLKVRGTPADERKTRVAEVARMLDIESLLDRSVHQISGGQQQRVALARAIIQRPKLYLLDEPISNLDAVLRSSMRGEIKRLQKMLETSTIVVTHDQLDALAMADRIAVMRDGAVQQVATPDEIYERPANTFVARFIGEPQMNLLSGTVEQRNGRGGVALMGHWVPVNPQDLGAVSRANLDSVTVGVRPKNVRIHQEPNEYRIPAEIYVATPEGSRTVYEFRLADQLFKVEAEPQPRFSMGDRVFLELPEGALHFFSPDTGRRIM
jgi:multiple sugar transport system ATP-binding protein